MPIHEQPSTRSDAWPEQLAVRVARCYYELGMTQQEVAGLIGIGRARVIKLLAEARERGVVSIRINSPLLEIVKHPINERIIGIHGDIFRTIPRRIMVSGGETRVKALHAILGQGLVTDLITDQLTAEALLK